MDMENLKVYILSTVKVACLTLCSFFFISIVLFVAIFNCHY